MASRQAQALAIKLSRERRAGQQIPAPPQGRYSKQTRRKAQRDLDVGRERTAGKTAGKKKKSKRAARRKKSSRAKGR